MFIPVDNRRPRVIDPRLAFTLAALAIGCVASWSATAAGTLERIRSRGAIELAYREDAAPFSFRDRDGRVRGYSVELCERVAESIRRSLGLASLDVRWRPVDASTRLDAIAKGDADIECGTTTMTLSRMERVDFSVPIYVDGGSVMVRAAAKLSTLDDLRGKRVAVIPNTTTEEALKAQLATTGTKTTLVPVRNATEGLDLLLSAKVEGYAGDRIVLTTLRRRAPKPESLGFLAQDFSFEPYALVVRRDDADFRLAVNRGLVGVYRSGEIDGIFQRWFAGLGRPGPLLNAMFYLQQIPE